MPPPAPARRLIGALPGAELKPTVILLITPPLLIAWHGLGSPAFYLQRLAGRWPAGVDPSAGAAVCSFLATFVLLAVLPALVVKLVFRERLADYGVQLGNRLRTLRSMAVYAPLMIAAAYVASHNAAIAAAYPINRSAGASPAMFGLHALSYVLFYLGWEFYFRGFMQFGLAGSLGKVNAVLVQVMASVLVHIGKPTIEIYAAIAAGILWGVLAFRTRSLLSGLVQHYLLGLAVDWFLVF